MSFFFTPHPIVSKRLFQFLCFEIQKWLFGEALAYGATYRYFFILFQRNETFYVYMLFIGLNGFTWFKIHYITLVAFIASTFSTPLFLKVGFLQYGETYTI